MKALNQADAQYHRLLLEIMANGKPKSDRTGVGTKSVFGQQIRFDMKDGFPLLTTKKIHFKSVVHELLWFLSGNTNTKYLNENGVTIWDEWADDNGDLGPVYGKQWVDWGSRALYDDGNPNPKRTPGINQIANAIDRLKTNPDCRRIIVSAWNVGELDQMALAPCHNFFQFYTRELTYEERKGICKVSDRVYPDEEWMTENNIPTRAISLMWNQRSVDVGLGLPFNIASYGLLLHMIGQQVNMVPDKLIGTLGDTHIYSNHIEQIKEQMKRSSKSEQPRLKLNKANDIFSYTYEDFEIIGYDAHPTIKMPIAI